jgi:glycosyltransferase involved in cell wall biosynthesis
LELMNKLSVVLATFNEEQNIGKCLDSVKDIADEIIIVDGSSSDRTVEIVKQYTDKVTVTDNPPIFHINKQKALDQATSEWVLQLDADEIVTKGLREEIVKVINMDSDELDSYQNKLEEKELFLRHQSLVEERDGKIGQDTGEINAFFIPRMNYFLGKYLRYGGVYPDGVIRLVRRGKSHFPCRSVHEQIEVEGRVGWLGNSLLHMADPTFKRYLTRNSRYIDLIVKEFKRDSVRKNISSFLNYVVIKPIWWFLLTLVRHKGILDGPQGLIFSFFSALRFPRAFFRYLRSE